MVKTLVFSPVFTRMIDARTNHFKTWLMQKQFLKDTLGWGVILWLVGYVLGMLLFAFVPPWLIGWVIMPIGTILTLLVLFKRIQSTTFSHYLWLAISWTILALVLDYFFLVKALNPADGYYKLDVYLYYALTFILPIIVGWHKSKPKGKMRH